MLRATCSEGARLYRRFIRSAIVWSGFQDPCLGRERIREDSDPELEEIRTLLSAWRAVFGDKKVLLSEVLDAANSSLEYQNQIEKTRELAYALQAFAPPGSNLPKTQKLSRSLGKWVGRYVEGLVLQSVKSASNHHSGKQWQVLDKG